MEKYLDYNSIIVFLRVKVKISVNHGLAFRFHSLLSRAIMDRFRGGLAKFLRFHKKILPVPAAIIVSSRRCDPFIQCHTLKSAVQKDHGSGNENGHFPSVSIRPLFENEA